jgi:mono/diheme cytochrome c family protein
VTNMRKALTASWAAWLVVPAMAFAADVDANGISDGWVFGQKDGAALYSAICASCHMPEGQGATGAGSYPALASNPRLASAQYPVVTVLRGRKGMPSFRYMLNDEQVAAVTNYIRTNLGNRYGDAVSAADVKPFR